MYTTDSVTPVGTATSKVPLPAACRGLRHSIIIKNHKARNMRLHALIVHWTVHTELQAVSLQTVSNTNMHYLKMYIRIIAYYLHQHGSQCVSMNIFLWGPY